jgi:hypothetical protein
VDELEINEVVKRLARPHPSGGVVIERAAIQASGSDFPAIIEWIIAHDGVPDTAVSPTRNRGLHGTRLADADTAADRKPQRFVLPAGSLS